MSTSRLITTNVMAINITIANTTGKSSRATASTIVEPRPGTRKICSATNEPPISAPVLMANTVTNENIDGRKACLNRTERFGHAFGCAPSG